MKHIIHHVLLPAIMPIIFFAIATTPVEVLGCARRGLLALLVAFISGLAALGTAIAGTRGRLRGNPNNAWWLATTVILAIPVVALIIMA